MIISYVNHTRYTHHTYAFILIIAYRFGHSRPRNNYTSAVFIRIALRCIQVYAVIKHTVFIAHSHFTAFFVKIRKTAYCRRIIRHIIIKYSDGRKDYYAFTVDFKIIRAFPNTAESSFFAIIHIFPVFEILAFEKQESSVIVKGASYYHIPRITATPYLRISGVGFRA